MGPDELRELLSVEGLRLLDSLPAWSSADDVVHTVSELRKQGHSPGLVAAVLAQARLRTRAAPKFGEFAARMLFTADGLEQATRLRVAALHAGRYQRAGIQSVADLGCGIGADSLALAALGIRVDAVDRDEVTAAVASYNLAPWPDVTVHHADAESFDLGGVEGVFLDPARRADGRRLRNPDDWSPSLDFAFGLGQRLPTGVKLAPGADRELIPDGTEAQWVSVDGDVVELGVWFGPLARPGVGRSALVLSADGAAELTAPADSPDAEAGALGEYLYEPDGAVIRARLIGDLARSLDARMLDPTIAYLTGDQAAVTPFTSTFQVLAQFPLDRRTLRKALSARGIGTLEIKKRGVDLDPAALRTELALAGDASATLILTRIAGKRRAILADRLPTGPENVPAEAD